MPTAGYAYADAGVRQSRNRLFFIEQTTGTNKGRPRQIKSCVGELPITEKQAQKLGLEPRSHLSPVLEKCSFRLCANESYQNAELELEALTGVKVGHSTLHRLVNRQDLPQPSALQAVSEVSLDGGKVRLRTPKGQECEWRDYKAVRLGGIYYGAFFHDHQSLLDWVNSQRLVTPLVCLGDGHDGVWKLFTEIGSSSTRLEILDWYHLRENLYKVGGSLKRLKLAENLLWIGEVDATMPAAGYAYALFVDKREKTGKEFLCIFEQASKSDYQLRLLSGGTDLLYWFWICGVCY